MRPRRVRQGLSGRGDTSREIPSSTAGPSNVTANGWLVTADGWQVTADGW